MSEQQKSYLEFYSGLNRGRISREDNITVDVIGEKEFNFELRVANSRYSVGKHPEGTSLDYVLEEQDLFFAISNPDSKVGEFVFSHPNSRKTPTIEQCYHLLDYGKENLEGLITSHSGIGQGKEVSLERLFPNALSITGNCYDLLYELSKAPITFDSMPYKSISSALEELQYIYETLENGTARDRYNGYIVRLTNSVMQEIYSQEETENLHTVVFSKDSRKGMEALGATFKDYDASVEKVKAWVNTLLEKAEQIRKMQKQMVTGLIEEAVAVFLKRDVKIEDGKIAINDYDTHVAVKGFPSTYGECIDMQKQLNQTTVSTPMYHPTQTIIGQMASAENALVVNTIENTKHLNVGSIPYGKLTASVMAEAIVASSQLEGNEMLAEFLKDKLHFPTVEKVKNALLGEGKAYPFSQIGITLKYEPTEETRNQTLDYLRKVLKERDQFYKKGKTGIDNT